MQNSFITFDKEITIFAFYVRGKWQAQFIDQKF